MVPADPDLLWGNQQTWGGPNSAVHYNNLFMNGEAMSATMDGFIWAGNGVWGGTHDDPKLNFLVQGDKY
jgi:hypothetical protein